MKTSEKAEKLLVASGAVEKAAFQYYEYAKTNPPASSWTIQYRNDMLKAAIDYGIAMKAALRPPRRR